jgi:Mn2+/Fe2+ NRAMP family transporter
MLPHKHFIISGFFIAILALIARLDVKTALLWILVGGFVSMIIDIDSIVLLAFTRNRKLMRFKSFKEIFLNFDGLISAFRETGKLMLLSATHSMISIVIVVITLLFFSSYLVPVLVGVISHLLSDLGYV